MAKLQRYDLRGITLEEDTFKCKRNLCERCGINCELSHEVHECSEFVPIIPFRPKIRGMQGTWNTFRIGTAWYNRLKVGTKIAVLNTKTLEIERYEVVKDIHFGLKEEMCQMYAKDNHNIIADNIYDNIAETMLQRMRKNYGSRIFESTSYATVIYF